MKVPFLDLKAQHDPIREELMTAIGQVIDRSAFAGGPFVADFEKDFAAFCRTSEAIGVGNGTDALWFALIAVGVGPGDEVITAPNSFMATAEAITYVGAKPVFVDIDETTYTIDPAKIEAAITPRTKAIIPVHLFGQTADMDPILAIAQKHNLVVIEDACQAHGAEYKGRRAGSIGHMGCFSFYPGKNLGGLGEGGAVTTNDAALASKIRVLREHGQDKKYYHSMIGWNGRMDGIQGAALRIKLRHLEQGNAARRANAQRYDDLLKGTAGLVLHPPAAVSKHVYHLYVIRVREQDRVIRAMAERGISCGIHYPVPIHLQKAYAFLGLATGSFPIAEQCCHELVSLPMFPELTGEQIEAVATELKAVLAS
jgi:dTDP-4-amino-4,6-dideoxygalactose transaminase